MSGTTAHEVKTSEYVCPECGARIVVPHLVKEGQESPPFPFDVEHITPSSHHLIER